MLLLLLVPLWFEWRLTEETLQSLNKLLQTYLWVSKHLVKRRWNVLYFKSGRFPEEKKQGIKTKITITEGSDSSE